MDTYVKINGQEYPASIIGKKVDANWGGRETKTIHLTMTSEDALTIFLNDTPWSIIVKDYAYNIKTDIDNNQLYDDNGQPILELVPVVTEYNNDEYCVAGPIIDNRDGTLDVKMGKYTNEEILLMEVLA